MFLEKVRDYFFRLSGCCSISDDDDITAELFDNFLQSPLCPRDIVFGLRRINRRVCRQLSCLVEGSYLTASSVAGVDTDDFLALDWRYHQKLLRILSKNFYRIGLRPLCQNISHLTLY